MSFSALGPSSADLANICPKLGQRFPSLSRIGPAPAESGHVSTKLGPMSGKIWPELRHCARGGAGPAPCCPRPCCVTGARSMSHRPHSRHLCLARRRVCAPAAPCSLARWVAGAGQRRFCAARLRRPWRVQPASATAATNRRCRSEHTTPWPDGAENAIGMACHDGADSDGHVAASPEPDLDGGLLTASGGDAERGETADLLEVKRCAQKELC